MSEKMVKTAYTDQRQDKYYGIEDKSWWFNYRIKVIALFAERFFDRNDIVIDIGGSNGFNTKKMQDAGFEMVLVEPTGKACDNAKRRGVQNVYNGTVEMYPGDINAFMLCDVLEHISDDTGFAKNLFEKLVYGGGGYHNRSGIYVPVEQ